MAGKPKYGLVPPPPPDAYPYSIAQTQQPPLPTPTRVAQAGGQPYGPLPPPPVAVSAIPTEEAGGIPITVPARLDPAAYALQADELMSKQKHYSRASELTGELDKRIHETGEPGDGKLTLNKVEREAAGLLAQYQNLNDQDPGSPWGADGGLMTRMLTLGSRKRYANQQAQRQSLAGNADALRLANQIIESGDKRLLETIGKYQALGGDWKDLFKTVAGLDDKSIDNARQAENLAVREHNLSERLKLAQMLNARQEQMQPFSIAQKQAGTELSQTNAQLGQAKLPYAGQQAAATLNLTQAAAADRPLAAARGMAGATGLMPNADILQRSGITPPAPGVEPVYTPKFQEQREMNDATLEGKKAALEKTKIETAAKSADLVRKATRAARAGVGADYWEKRSELWDALPKEEKMKLLQKYASEK